MLGLAMIDIKETQSIDSSYHCDAIVVGPCFIQDEGKASITRCMNECFVCGHLFHVMMSPHDHDSRCSTLLFSNTARTA